MNLKFNIPLDFLAMDVGNTHLHVGTFLRNRLEATAIAECGDREQVRKALETAVEALATSEAPCVVIGSVNPDAAQYVLKVIQELDLPVYWADKDAPIPVGRQLDPEAIVGDDRLLNAAAAFDVLKQACVVIDAGTAVTVDYVDGAGTFHGGAIAPGAQMMLDALHEGTAQLPKVAFAAPQEAIGHSTVEAMRTAVYYGLRGMVRELVERYAEVSGAYPMVIATGGDAERLFKNFELVERIVPELTLMGLAVTLRATLAEE